MHPIKELSHLLRPAGGGVYLVSTGRDEQRALQHRLYGVATDDEVAARFRDSLTQIATARAIVLGIPSDVGAGFVRGANLGPQAIRKGLLDTIPNWAERTRAAGVVDVGDVFVVPQLLHDSMVSDAQRMESQRALYADVFPEEAARLPVSPLSIAERALDLVFALNPYVVPIVLGGDHSVAWPVVSALARVQRDDAGPTFGIVQPDAHTDLLETRLGVKYCFGTWSFHANELLGRGGRLVQVGIRASRFDQAHWESTLGVRQFWADACRADPSDTIDAIVAHLKKVGVQGVYFSNDIDGTDAAFADATGTPEPHGLDPEFVIELIRRLGSDIGIVAGDVVEVAPMLGRRADGGTKTANLAARYVRETIEAALKCSL